MPWSQYVAVWFKGMWFKEVGMQPWFEFWAPHLHFPLSGDIAQRIQPTANWFFESIPPTAGDSRIEQKAFDVASYGRQLGLITEVLLDLADTHELRTDEVRKSRDRLRDISKRIAALKDVDASAQWDEIQQRIETFKRTHRKEFESRKPDLQRSLSTNGAGTDGARPPDPDNA